MNWLRNIGSRLRALFAKRRLDREMDEEIRAHIEMQTEANLDSGVPQREARSKALLQFGPVESLKETCREQRGMAQIESLFQDLRYGARMLFKNPGFTTAAALTLALGIGANTAIFSVINGVLLKPLPYPEPERLVTVWERHLERGVDQQLVSGPNFLDWRAQNSTFENLSVSPGWSGSTEFNLVRGDGVTTVNGSYVSSSLFATLGRNPALGRSFTQDEDQKEGNRVAVLSHGLWQRLFGASSNVIGQTLTVDTYGRRDYTIVGVMPKGFGLPGEAELWLPLGWMGVTLDERRSAHWHQVIGRLKRGVSIERARTELNMIQARIAQQHPDALVGTEVTIVPLLDHALGRHTRLALLLLWGVVAGILLIACANVANLLLARAADRQKEIALRVALGASRWRVIRQLLVESVLLSVIGGALGILIGWWGIQFCVAADPGRIPRMEEVTLDGWALGFTLAISTLTGILFGLAPAWQFSRPDLNEALKERCASSALSSSRVRSALVIAEVAMSLVLLAAAGLMLQSFAKLARTDRGFRPESLLTAKLDFSVSGFTSWVQPTSTRPQVPLYEVMERLRTRPGVQAVAAASALPKEDNSPPSQTFIIAGRPPLAPDALPTAYYTGVSPDYFRALGVPLLRGRTFSEQDHLEAPQVLIISETVARLYFQNDDPIGKRIAMGGRNNPARADQPVSSWPEVVGVVADVKNLGADPKVHPQIYVPYWQWPMQSPALLVRTAGETTALVSMIRSEVKSVIPNLPAPAIQTMNDLLADSVAQPRFQAWLLSVFGLVALALASVGLYGVLAYSVKKRTQEIGIRIALGAQRGDVVSMVIGHGMKLALAGVAIGIVASFGLTRLMRSLLYEIHPGDPLTLAAVSLLLGSVALLACWIPARHAAKVDPMVALRYE